MPYNLMAALVQLYRAPTPKYSVLRLFEPRPYSLARTPSLTVEWVLLGPGSSVEISVDGMRLALVQNTNSTTIDLSRFHNGRHVLNVTVVDALTRYPLSANQTDVISGPPASLFHPTVLLDFDLQGLLLTKQRTRGRGGGRKRSLEF